MERGRSGERGLRKPVEESGGRPGGNGDGHQTLLLGRPGVCDVNQKRPPRCSKRESEVGKGQDRAEDALQVKLRAFIADELRAWENWAEKARDPTQRERWLRLAELWFTAAQKHDPAKRGPFLKRKAASCVTRPFCLTWTTGKGGTWGYPAARFARQTRSPTERSLGRSKERLITW
jgi:hypothetical protein